jgi:hypothetical protein
MVTKFNLHRVFKGKDEVIGTFEVRDNEIHFASHADEHHCSMFPAGPMSEYTKNRISHLLDNEDKTMYLEKAK